MIDIAPEALPRLHFEDACVAATHDELPAASFTLVSGTCGCQTAREETLARESTHGATLRSGVDS